jgi:hypothetical protein
VYRPSYHDVAAQELNLSMNRGKSKPTRSGGQKCPNCGTMSDAGVIMCPVERCGYLFDPDAYAKISKERFANRQQGR